MTAPVPFSPYSSALPFFQGNLNWVIDADDLDRLKAYELYDRMYWNEPGTFKLIKRGEDERDVYIPSCRKIIEATNQFLAKDWGYVLDPSAGSESQRQKVRLFLDALFKREMWLSKFGALKRNTLRRADGFIHITADDTKEQGKRISIHQISASTYFPIYEGLRRIGVHLVEQIKDPRDPDGKKYIVKRQTYRKNDETGFVSSELSYWESDAWDDRHLEPKDLKRVRHQFLNEIEEHDLEDIPAIPVYHFKNIEWDQWPFGVSELRGIEGAIAAVNQSLTDEDLTLIMQGLGVYWTNAGPPKDAEGDETALEIGPGVVLEVPDGNTVGRLNGVSSVAPMLDHMKFILEQTESSLGVSGAAAGKVDVAIAESGISLYLQLGPMLAKNEEKELSILGQCDHILFDLLNYWLPAYEDFTDGVGLIINSVVGDPVPVNREKKLIEVQTLHDANLILTEMAIAELTKLGYEFPPNAAELLLEQQKSRTAAATPVDPFAERTNEELNGQEEGGDPDEG